MKFYLRRVRLNGGGYDRSGQYWGVDLPLYEYESEDRIDGDYVQEHIRAYDRDHAKAKVLAKYAAATFAR